MNTIDDEIIKSWLDEFERSGNSIADELESVESATLNEKMWMHGSSTKDQIQTHMENIGRLCVYKDIINSKDMELKEKSRFDDFLSARNDSIYNAAANFCEVIIGEDDKEILNYTKNLNANILGPIIEAAEKVLYDNQIPTCYPYYESDDDSDEVPCYKKETCNNPNCMYKKVLEVYSIMGKQQGKKS